MYDHSINKITLHVEVIRFCLCICNNNINSYLMRGDYQIPLKHRAK